MHWAGPYSARIIATQRDSSIRITNGAAEFLPELFAALHCIGRAGAAFNTRRIQRRAVVDACGIQEWRRDSARCCPTIPHHPCT